MGLPRCYNFAAFDMATKFGWVNGQPGIGAVEPVATGLTSLADRLRGVRDRSDLAIRELEVQWHGQASAAAQESLTGSVKGMDGTATVTQNASERLTEYGHSFEAMRRQIAYDDPARYGAWGRVADGAQEVWAGLSGGDHVTIAERNQANDEAANRALHQHSVETSGVDDRIATATAPPAAGGAAPGGSGSGGAAPVGPLPGTPQPLPAPDTTGPAHVGTPGPGPAVPPAPTPAGPAPGGPPAPSGPSPVPAVAGTPGGGNPGGGGGTGGRGQGDGVGNQRPAPAGSGGPRGGGGGRAGRGRTPAPDASIGRPEPTLPGRRPGERTSPGTRFGQDVRQNALVPRQPGPYGSGGSGDGGYGTRPPLGRGIGGGAGPDARGPIGRGPGTGIPGSGGGGSWDAEPRGPGGRPGTAPETWAGTRPTERSAVPPGYGPLTGAGAGTRDDQEHRNRYVVPTDEVFDIPVPATDAVLGPDEEDHRR